MSLLSSCFREKKFVALKVVKSAAHYTETALDEIKLLKCVSFFSKNLTKHPLQLVSTYYHLCPVIFQKSISLFYGPICHLLGHLVCVPTRSLIHLSQIRD